MKLPFRNVVPFAFCSPSKLDAHHLLCTETHYFQHLQLQRHHPSTFYFYVSSIGFLTQANFLSGFCVTLLREPENKETGSGPALHEKRSFYKLHLGFLSSCSLTYLKMNHSTVRCENSQANFLLQEMERLCWTGSSCCCKDDAGDVSWTLNGFLMEIYKESLVASIIVLFSVLFQFLFCAHEK